MLQYARAGALVILVATAVSVAQAAPAYTGHYVPGVEGVKGSSLPPPGFYVRDYNVCYFAHRLNNADGDEVPININALVYANLIRPVWITDWTILGTSVGMDMIVPIIYTDLSIRNRGPFPHLKESDIGIGDL